MNWKNIPLLFLLVLFCRIRLGFYYLITKNKDKLNTHIENEKLFFSKCLLKIVGIDKNLNFSIKTKELPSNFIYICNHRSFTDILITEVLFSKFNNKHSIYIAKEELKNKFLFGKLLVYFKAYFIKRGEQESSKDMMSFIKNTNNEETNKGFVIFPEGTRNISGEIGLQKFEKGVDLISRKYKIPVVPVYISGFPESYYEKWDLNKQSDIEVTVGEAFFPSKDISTEENYKNFLTINSKNSPTSNFIQ